MSKWGNSLGVRIPRSMAERLHIGDGTRVEVIGRNQEIVIRRKRYSLEELLKGVTPENMDEETEWGGPKGEEEW